MRVQRPLVIGLGHKAEQGKDEVAKAIFDSRGGQFDIRLYSFAKALRAEVAGREEELCRIHGIKYEPENKNRALLQWWGTDYRRASDQDYWVKKLADEIFVDNPQIAIITDCRFPNELDYVEKTMKGVSVKVTRLGHHSERTHPKHLSEMALDKHEFMAEIIVPTGQLSTLHATGIALFDALVMGMGIQPSEHPQGEDYGDVSTHKESIH